MEQKFNESLCEQVRQGKLAIENNEETKLSDLHDLLKWIFPFDGDADFNLDMLQNYDYFYRDRHKKNNWTCYDTTDLPTRPVSDFFEPVELERGWTINGPLPTPESPAEGEAAKRWSDYDHESKLLADEYSRQSGEYRHQDWQPFYDAYRKAKFANKIPFIKEPSLKL